MFPVLGIYVDPLSSDAGRSSVQFCSLREAPISWADAGSSKPATEIDVPRTPRSAHHCCGLRLPERRLVASRSTVIIPFDDRVIFVGLLNRAQFSSRLSEVPQALHAVSRIHFRAGCGLGQRWFFRTVCVRRRAPICEGRLWRFAKFGYWLFGGVGHISFPLSKTG